MKPLLLFILFVLFAAGIASSAKGAEIVVFGTVRKTLPGNDFVFYPIDKNGKIVDGDWSVGGSVTMTDLERAEIQRSSVRQNFKSIARCRSIKINARCR